MTNPQYAYFDDPLKLTFEADVIETRPLEGARWGVVLSETYFYPTGGGQAHDTGLLDDVRVLDVWRDEATSQVVHVVTRELAPGRVAASIDRQRRLRHMQHHTAQHLLSACCYQLYDLDTLSSGIHGYAPSTIDLPDVPLSEEQLRDIEILAHEKIFADLTVKTYFLAQHQLDRIPLRRPPKVSGDVRIVEIDGFDYSACGATHCLSTGMIGLLKIVKTERKNQKMRLHFMAGEQALSYFQEIHALVSGLAEDASVRYAELPQAFNRQVDALKAAQKELAGLRRKLLAAETERLLRDARPHAGLRWAVTAFEQRPADDIRALAKLLRAEPGLVTVLATRHDGKLALVVACADDVARIHAGELLQELLRPIGGRGGGGAQMAQGGGLVTAPQFQALREALVQLGS